MSPSWPSFDYFSPSDSSALRGPVGALLQILPFGGSGFPGGACAICGCAFSKRELEPSGPGLSSSSHPTPDLPRPFQSQRDIEAGRGGLEDEY